MKAVEFAILLRDKASSTIEKIGREFSTTTAKANGLKSSVSSLTGIFGGLKNMLGVVGVGFGFYKVVEMMRAGVDKAHELHLANAQIEAGLKSTNYAAGVTMETLEKGANKIKSASLYGGVELKNMQSIMLTFPKIGAKIFDPASQSIADMSTRMKMDLSHAAVMVGKALQDPVTGVMMMRRIGVNFTREQVAGFKQLVAAGKLQEAQLLILKELQIEFGGSAKAAFDASPMAQYNKMVSAIQIKLGDLALEVQDKIAPTLLWMATETNKGINKLEKSVKWLYKQFEDGNPFVWTAAGAFAAYNIAILIALTRTKLMAWWSAASFLPVFLSSIATYGWATAWDFLTASMLANPIGLIIVAVAALVALVWGAVKYWDKWGATLLFFMGPLGWIVNTIMVLKNNWDSIVDAFTNGGIIGGLKRIGIVLLDVILYPVQQLLGLLAKIPGLSKLAGSGEQLIAGMRRNLGLVDPKSSDPLVIYKPPKKDKNKKVDDKKDNAQTAQAVASGGTRNTSIYITVGKMVESLIYNGGVGENAGDVEKKIEEILMRALFAAESAS